MQDSLIVLKFGSSVLGSAEDIPNAVHEIYRWYRRGYRVLAVVSALGDTTNDLLKAGQALDPTPEPYALAELLATGERESAALLGVALDRVGVRARVVDPRDIELKASGSVLDSEPVTVNVERANRFLTDSPVLVIPGFFGFDEKGRLHLFGRGGSDMTAAFLACALRATRCRLLKDIDGIFEFDPAQGRREAPRRFAALSYIQALKIARPLIQPKAVELLDRHQSTAEVAALTCSYESVVCTTTVMGSGSHTSSPLKVVLLGLGNVGGGVYRRLLGNATHFTVVSAFVRSKERHLGEGVPASILETNEVRLLEREVDIVVDALSGVETSSRLVPAFLTRGVSVVTANKALIADAGAHYKTLAERHGGALRYSAAVGGSAPMIESVQKAREAGEIIVISGILNGTCNFVLGRCETGVSLQNAVREAQLCGYAEADPAEDLSGRDSARKLQILARHAFDVAPDEMSVEEISEVSLINSLSRVRPNYRLRLIGTLNRIRSGIQAAVRLEWIGPDHPFAQIDGAWNGLTITFASGETVPVTGRGAGRWPTTEAVMSDLWDIRRDAEALSTPLESEWTEDLANRRDLLHSGAISL